MNRGCNHFFGGPNFFFDNFGLAKVETSKGKQKGAGFTSFITTSSTTLSPPTGARGGDVDANHEKFRGPFRRMLIVTSDDAPNSSRQQQPRRAAHKPQKQ
jgi:hypothetical protein